MNGTARVFSLVFVKHRPPSQLYHPRPPPCRPCFPLPLLFRNFSLFLLYHPPHTGSIPFFHIATSLFFNACRGYSTVFIFFTLCTTHFYYFLPIPPMPSTYPPFLEEEEEKGSLIVLKFCRYYRRSFGIFIYRPLPYRESGENEDKKVVL